MRSGGMHNNGTVLKQTSVVVLPLVNSRILDILALLCALRALRGFEVKSFSSFGTEVNNRSEFESV
jgi:hypothetical protein